eukprot:Clim_evm22s34 gene=Clim_evmTU22s34
MSTNAKRRFFSSVGILLSKNHDPFVNLAFEEYIFRRWSFVTKPYLLLYVNRPCVVIGRNQNPWQECNLSAMAERQIPLVRRKSGGGAVYHDLGNLNMSMLTTGDIYDKYRTAEVVRKAVTSLKDTDRFKDLSTSITPASSDRQDVLLGDHKVSGSAYKIGRNAYHHCTLLIDADLNGLRGLLRHPFGETAEWRSKGVESVRSPVTNVGEFMAVNEHGTIDRRENLMHQSVKSIAQSFADEFTDFGDQEIVPGKGIPEVIEFDPLVPLEEQMIESPLLKSKRLADGQTSAQVTVTNATELRSWDWIFGQTPHCEFSTALTPDLGLFVTIYRGRLKKVSVAASTSDGAESVQASPLSPDANTYMEETVLPLVNDGLLSLKDLLCSRSTVHGILSSMALSHRGMHRELLERVRDGLDAMLGDTDAHAQPSSTSK